MAKVFRPQPPNLPNTLPFEKQIGSVLDKVNEALQNNPITRAMQHVEDSLPIVEGMDLPTPLGTIRTPTLRAPSFTPPVLDERRKEAMKAAIGTDLGTAMELIPMVGDILEPIGNGIADTYRLKLMDMLTPEELPVWKNEDKISPLTSFATAQTFLRKR